MHSLLRAWPSTGRRLAARTVSVTCPRRLRVRPRARLVSMPVCKCVRRTSQPTWITVMVPGDPHCHFYVTDGDTGAEKAGARPGVRGWCTTKPRFEPVPVGRWCLCRLPRRPARTPSPSAGVPDFKCGDTPCDVTENKHVLRQRLHSGRTSPSHSCTVGKSWPSGRTYTVGVFPPGQVPHLG